jgi:hypothetical protein
LLPTVWQALVDRWATFLMAVLCAAGAVAMARKGITELRSSRALGAWPSVEGRIVAHSELEESFDRRPYGTAHVTYEYAVDGATHRGTLARDAKPLADVKDMLARYPVGATIAVHYCPEDPQDSFIEARAGGNTVVRFGLAVGLGLAGLVLAYSGFRPQASSAPE